jgi:DNA-binding response OmpR family regulator
MGGQFILVVDDDPAVARSLAGVFESAGYQAVTAPDGATALKIASGVAIDLALVDVRLPDSDGIQTAVEIYKKLPNCKILLVSGVEDPNEKPQKARSDGINFEILAKPIPPPELLKKVESLLSQAA